MSRIPARERRRHNERRSLLFLLTGLLIGLGFGLVIAWLLFPARVGAVDPSLLADSARDQYRAAIALAYAASGDLGRAEARLALLGDGDAARTLRNQAQLALLEPDAQRQARALSQLADALDAKNAPTATPNPEEEPTGVPDQDAEGG